jgi:hypothetical protein
MVAEVVVLVMEVLLETRLLAVLVVVDGRLMALSPAHRGLLELLGKAMLAARA